MVITPHTLVLFITLAAQCWYCALQTLNTNSIAPEEVRQAHAHSRAGQARNVIILVKNAKMVGFVASGAL